MRAPNDVRLTIQDLRQRPETTQPAQLIDGVLPYMPSPVALHQAVLRALVRLLEGVLHSGSLWFAPMDVYLDDFNAVQPDIFWVAQGSTQCTLADGRYWYGAPELVIDVLSIGTETNDRETKFKLYQRFGVHEYWLVSPDSQTVEVYVRQQEHLTLQGTYHDGAPFSSKTCQTQITFKFPALPA